MIRMPGTVSTTVTKLPKCNLCGDAAKYDIKMIGRGQWAYLCRSCAKLQGCGKLGTGYGQELVLKDSSGTSDLTPDPTLDPLDMAILIVLGLDPNFLQ